jgi:hypothetical protein
MLKAKKTQEPIETDNPLPFGDLDADGEEGSFDSFSVTEPPSPPSPIAAASPRLNTSPRITPKPSKSTTESAADRKRKETHRFVEKNCRETLDDGFESLRAALRENLGRGPLLLLGNTLGFWNSF